MRRPTRGAKTIGALLVVGAWSLACTSVQREPGPHEEERGRVTFWEVTDLTLSDEGCTDDPGFADALVTPALEPNTFFMYAVSDDGTVAVAQDCTELSADSCSEVVDLTFEVDGHELVWIDQGDEVIARSPVCEVFGRQAWSFVDGGETATLDVVIDFPFEGTDNGCDELDEQLAEQGSNGYGLATCEVVLSARLAFTLVD
jgi:hypothetical protein